MLFRILNALRQKPKHVRDQYAFGGAVIFTAIVMGVWSLSLPARFSTVAQGVSEAQPAAAPFSHMFSQLKEQLGKGFGGDESESSIELAPNAPGEPVLGLPELTATTTLYDIPTSTPTKEEGRPILIGTSSASTTAP